MLTLLLGKPGKDWQVSIIVHSDSVSNEKVPWEYCQVFLCNPVTCTTLQTINVRLLVKESYKHKIILSHRFPYWKWCCKLNLESRRIMGCWSLLLFLVSLNSFLGLPGNPWEDSAKCILKITSVLLLRAGSTDGERCWVTKCVKCLDGLGNVKQSCRNSQKH